MAAVLTSWKEIAQYVGKGVRTVQRWEQQFSLPVRRLNSEGHHAVLAIPEEIDAWLRLNTKARAEGAGESELERLRRRVMELQEKNDALRLRLISLSDAAEAAGERGTLEAVPERHVA
jgi:predicted DNA-binding transcriptional regulator AlpA